MRFAFARAAVKATVVYQSERPIFAILARIGAAFFIATLLMLVKYSGDLGIAFPEIIFWRQAMTIPIVLGVLGATGGLHRLKSNRLPSHAMRGMLSLIGMSATFGAAILLTLPQASILSFTSPFFAVLLSVLVIGEPAGRWRWGAVGLGFCGVLVMSSPGGEHFNLLGALCGLTAALVIVVVSYQVKDLARTDDPIACVFYLSLFTSAILVFVLPFVITRHTPFEWGLLLASGLCGLIAQFLVTVSLKYGAVGSVLIMDYTSLIWATLYGWLIFGDLPHAATWLGAPLIIAAGLVITWREHVLAKAASPISTNALD